MSLRTSALPCYTSGHLSLYTGGAKEGDKADLEVRWDMLFWLHTPQIHFTFCLAALAGFKFN